MIGEPDEVLLVPEGPEPGDRRSGHGKVLDHEPVTPRTRRGDVAQGAKLPELLRGPVGLRPMPGVEDVQVPVVLPLNLTVEPGGGVDLGLQQVPGLPGIAAQVIQLLGVPQPVEDQLPSPLTDGLDQGAHRPVGVKGALRVDRPGVRHRGIRGPGEGPQGPALDLLRHRHPGPLQQGGEYVDEAHGAGDPPADPVLCGVEDDEGDVQTHVVTGVGVSEEPVLQQLLAVVGGDQDHGVAVQTVPAQGLQDGPHRIVPVGDGGVVQVRVVLEVAGDARVFPFVAPLLHRGPPGAHHHGLEEQGVLHVEDEGGGVGHPAELGGRNPVRVVDVEEVKVRQEGAVSLLRVPADELRGRLGQLEGRSPVLLEVLVEPLVHPVLPARQAVGDECRRGVAGVAEDLGHGQVRVLEHVVRVHVPVGEGVLAGEEGGGGGLGVVRRCVATREEGSPLRQLVDGGAGGLSVPVAAETVRPQCVHEKDEDVRPRGLRGGAGGQGAQGGRCGDEERKNQGNGQGGFSCHRVVCRAAGFIRSPGCNVNGVP